MLGSIQIRALIKRAHYHPTPPKLSTPNQKISLGLLRGAYPDLPERRLLTQILFLFLCHSRSRCIRLLSNFKSFPDLRSTAVSPLSSHLPYTSSPAIIDLPPGPRGLPIIGNTYQLPHIDEVSQVIIGWARKYGEIFRIRLGMTDYTFNSPEVVKELMD